MDRPLELAARDAIGFMPHDEGVALYRAALAASSAHPMLEIGSYCGKSAVYLGAAAQRVSTILFSVDHHRGSEEHQPGEEYHDPRLVDGAGRVDTLPEFRKTIERAGLEEVVVAVVGRSAEVARRWATPLGFVFVDGGHGRESAHADYHLWAPKVALGGFLAIHDVFDDPSEGGTAPREIYRRALETGGFDDESSVGTLRVLRRVRDVV